MKDASPLPRKTVTIVEDGNEGSAPGSPGDLGDRGFARESACAL